MKQRILFFDLARCVAALAVITIHVLGPYRHGFGEIPFSHWLVATSVNSASRWAVPLFILITGALLLSDTRPFELRYYLRRRLAKVLVPFIAWSLLYAFLSGWSLTGFDADLAFEVLVEFPHHATYYHLGFFYYFIPLYLIAPFFRYLIDNYDDAALYAFIGVWLATTLLFLMRIDGPWSHPMWLYSGYLPLGYVLYQKVSISQRSIFGMVVVGVAVVVVTQLMVLSLSVEAGKYSMGRWLSYKTLNTVAVATMVFLLCRYFAHTFTASVQRVVGFISRHSLGIYLLHPIFLWPMKALSWHQGNPLWVIPLWVLVSGSLSLLVSWLLSRVSATRWLVP